MVRVRLVNHLPRVPAVTRLIDVISGTQALLLDFDGPVCSVFAGYTAEMVAEDLRNSLRRQGVTFPADIAASRDPLQVLRWVGDTNPGITQFADDVLTAAERRAVATAEPTAGSSKVITAAARTGRQIAIVSNNSHAAITAYLERHRLTPYVRLVVGRAYAQPALMKPHTHSVARALNALGVNASASVLVGDSPTDMEAAHTMHVRTIGYAKDPARATGLGEAQADIVINTMRSLVTALEAMA